MPEVGETAPDFTLSSTTGATRLRPLGGVGKLVVAFYIEDGTPG